jgi:tyrosinase
MPKTRSPFTRRSFLKTSLAAAAGATSLPTIATYAFTPPQRAKYVRYNVTSDRGQRAVKSYNNAIQTMLKLPPTHPHNWFRNAFVHLMDCPHGNWWFYVWHRGYLGYFEETIRNLSGDSSFAIPYWDWTTLSQIPEVMFDDALTPVSRFFEPYTKNLAVFTSFIQPALKTYWSNLNSAQLAQLKIRQYPDFDSMWNDVTGNGDSGNIGYAPTCSARYLSRDNPMLDPYTAKNCSPGVIWSGLQPTDYYNQSVSLSFTSSKTPSHMTPPGQNTAFSTLEGMPHNKVHNYIGGVGPLGPGPYGNMTNFLSPVDPIFFLHHSNMDRLWDVWTRKQQSLGMPILPPEPDRSTLSNEQFLFYVNGNGQFVGTSKAGDYLSTARFDYEYQPGFPDILSERMSTTRQKRGRAQIRGVVRGNRASATVPSEAIKEHLAANAATLVAEVTVPHPSPSSQTREFHVLVGAPSDVTEPTPDSPFLAGTVAFFGNMGHAHGPASDATFAVPLPKTPQAFTGLAAVNSTVNIRIVPAYGNTQRPPMLKSVTIRAV